KIRKCKLAGGRVVESVAAALPLGGLSQPVEGAESRTPSRLLAAQLLTRSLPWSFLVLRMLHQPAVLGTNTPGASAIHRKMLYVSAFHSSTHNAFRLPRTKNRSRLRHTRRSPFTVSAVAARSR